MKLEKILQLNDIKLPLTLKKDSGSWKKASFSSHKGQVQFQSHGSFKKQNFKDGRLLVSFFGSPVYLQWVFQGPMSSLKIQRL